VLLLGRSIELPSHVAADLELHLGQMAALARDAKASARNYADPQYTRVMDMHRAACAAAVFSPVSCLTVRALSWGLIEFIPSPRHSLTTLHCLLTFGGRFNIGQQLPTVRMAPW